MSFFIILYFIMLVLKINWPRLLKQTAFWYPLTTSLVHFFFSAITMPLPMYFLQSPMMFSSNSNQDVFTVQDGLLNLIRFGIYGFILKVHADKVSIEMDDIGKGIIELVYHYHIKKLVMGAAAKKHYSEY